MTDLLVEGLHELQIRERTGLSDADVIAQLQVVGAKAVKGRFGTPVPMRWTPIRSVQPVTRSNRPA